MQQHRLSLTLLSALLLASAGAAYAAHAGAANDALAIEQAHISLTQAVAAAEQHAGGKAAKAEFEHSRKGNFYEVEVVTSAHQVFDVRVDAQQGQVLSSRLDKADGADQGEDD